jgi:hypothetical protein
MNVPDIRANILLQFPLDQLIGACSTDQLSYQICSSEAFWIRKFEIEGLPMMNRRTNLKGWIWEYKYSLLCKQRTPLIMKILKDPHMAYGDGILAFNILGPNDLSMITSQVNLGEAEDKYLSTFMNKKTNPNAPKILVFNADVSYNPKDNSYYFGGFSGVIGPNAFKLKISEETAYNVIYRVEYSGMKHALLHVSEAILSDPARNYGIGKIDRRGAGRITL